MQLRLILGPWRARFGRVFVRVRRVVMLPSPRGTPAARWRASEASEERFFSDGTITFVVYLVVDLPPYKSAVASLVGDLLTLSASPR